MKSIDKVTTFRDNGTVERVCFLYKDLLHNVNDEPADIWYDVNGKVTGVYHYRHGLIYREHGPAITKYDHVGRVVYKGYYGENGELRAGPCEVYYNYDVGDTASAS